MRDDQWHLVTFIRDKENNKVLAYVDSTKDIDYSGAIADKTTTIPHRIGRDSRAGNTAFEGLINDVKIYGRALTEGEISDLVDR